MTDGTSVDSPTVSPPDLQDKINKPSNTRTTAKLL